MLGRNILTTSIFVTVASAIPAAEPQATPPPLWHDVKVKGRQQVPFSIPSVIPSAVDTRFYSEDGSTTKFIGSTTAYLSVPTVTGTSSGKTITTTEIASMALYSAKPSGQSDYEYSLVVAPELADEIAAVLTSSSNKRDLDERAVPAPTISGLIKLLAPKMANSLLKVPNLAALTEIPGLSLLATGIIEIGDLAIAGVAFLVAVVNQFSLITDLIKDGGKVTAVVVPNPFQNFRDTKTCPNPPPKCSSCSGKDFLCTSGNDNKCPCEEDKEQLETIDSDPVYPDVSWLDTQQEYLQKLLDFVGEARGSPSQNPTCGDRASVGLSQYTLLGHHQISDGANATPHDILYMMRETLCNNKCENPAKIPTNSVKATRKGTSGCEIAVALTANMEAWAVRDLSSTGDEWQDCWDSLANATEKCTDMTKSATGWVNGPDDYEFFQIGYRALNGQGSLHSKFDGNDALPQWCGNSKPKCDTCMGGGNGNKCSQGEFSGCDCEAVTATQPSLPKVTNCATALAAAEIICCGWSDDTKNTCSQMINGCGVTADLGAICQSAVDGSGGGTYKACGQSNKDDAIVKESHMEDIATCLTKEFNLKASFIYS
ncbi:hypothetical protein F5Y13DRAFT_206440 [Hypoxylon sp. FL1857]|nr:hypothetical protein F5Y13DRAFT_206440 [Hypoxylon sp. FL1857]